MTGRLLITTGSPFETAGAYSRVVIQGDWCFLSGTTGYDYATMEISGDVVAQTLRIFETVEGLLEENGFALADVVKVTCIIDRQEYWPAVYGVLGRKFCDIRPVLLTYVAPLIEPAMKVELQMTALRRPKVPSAGETPEDRLRAMGIALPPVPVPIASYVAARTSGNLLFLSGQVPVGGSRGKVGDTVTVEQAATDARQVGLQLLAVAQEALGRLDRITAVIKLLGMVNATPHFADHPRVINGCSDLLVEVLGDIGKHARSAIGMGSLPGNVSVEIEAIFEYA